MERVKSQSKVFLSWLGVSILLVFSLESVSLLSLWVLGRAKGIVYQPVLKDSLSEENRVTIRKFLDSRDNYFTQSPVLGWTIKPGGSSGLYKANAQGLRAAQDYKIPPPPGMIRISAFGDSFTHGDEVGINETWEEQLKRLDARLEVLNFGVSGYGLDQAFLKYGQDGISFQPALVLIGFFSEDIDRAVSVFYPLQGATRFPLAKPRFIIRDSHLILLKNPLPGRIDYESFLKNEASVLPKLGTHDYDYQIKYGRGPFDFLASVRLFKIAAYVFRIRQAKNHISDWSGTYNPDSEAFQLTVRTFDKFHESVLANGSLPLILLFPDRYDLARYRARGIKRYAPLADFLRQRGYAYIDLFDAFDKYGKTHAVSELCGAHYTPLGNEIVAKSIFDYLKEKNPLNAESK